MQKLNICDPMDQLYTGFMSLRAKEKARKYGLFEVEHTGLEPFYNTQFGPKRSSFNLNLPIYMDICWNYMILFRFKL